MLKNANLYMNELQTKILEIWYDPKYHNYFEGYGRWTPVPYNLGEETTRFNFVSVDKQNNVVGYIGYLIAPTVRLAYNFGAMSFFDDSIAFACDLRRSINEIFTTWGLQTLEWSVVWDNPARHKYDRLIKHCGGRIVGRQSNRVCGLDGQFHDTCMYEIRAKDYFEARGVVR